VVNPLTASIPKIMNQPTFLNPDSLIRSFGLICGVALLSQCSAPVSVRMEKPIAPAGAPAASAGIDHHLASIRDAHDRILRGDDSAVPAYNYSVARLVEELERSGADPWSGTITSGSFRIKGAYPARSKPLEHKLIPTDTLRFRGKIAEEQSKVDGLGAPVVEVGSIENLGHVKLRENLPLRNLTALVRFEGNLVILELVDPYQVEQVGLGASMHRLAADYGAAIMLGMSHARVDKLGLARLLRPTRYNDTANLNFMQPYDPKRIPVLFVHGLDSTPATFAPMYFKLLEDPEIRENYQFWVFSYPSGYPYPYSASLLRRELDEVRRDYPGHKNMVIVGHSMGSLISRLMVTDAGEKIWISAFGKSPSETRNITGHSRDILLKSAVFEDRKEIDRAVFYSGPHRGSELATNWIGRTAARLVKMPGLLADTRNVLLSTATADVAGLVMNSAPNSIGTLSPDNPFVREINKIPITPRVPYHSIMGDRGKGDTPDSSDGVVAYWSSHLDGAVSEKIVPSGHGSHENPEGIEEARRILKLHLESR
jgi:pimeloyl-ACP methyl ester carboxylesterase